MLYFAVPLTGQGSESGSGHKGPFRNGSKISKGPDREAFEADEKRWNAGLQ